MKPDFDKAWDMILEDDRLESIRRKLSVHELRHLFYVAVEGLCGPPESTGLNAGLAPEQDHISLKRREVMTITVTIKIPPDVEAVVIELVPTPNDPFAHKNRKETIVEPGKEGIFHIWGEKQIFIAERSLRDRIKDG